MRVKERSNKLRRKGKFKTKNTQSLLANFASGLLVERMLVQTFFFIFALSSGGSTSEDGCKHCCVPGTNQCGCILA